MELINVGAPCAAASVSGSGISGTVQFYPFRGIVLVVADIRCLPRTEANIFAVHIHEGASCGGEDFSASGAHYNPQDVRHPRHAGDLPPLFSNSGSAFTAVMTDRFSINEIIGRTVIIHDMPDDFRTQPAGNSGGKIACGVIRRV